MTTRERFYRKALPEPNTGCWLWTGWRTPFGHGQFQFNGRLDCAHRASFAMHVAEIPAGMQVLHRCDVPECVNPDHLFLGTQLDNMHDMHGKGRRTYRRRVSLDQVAMIRRRMSGGEKQSHIADELGVDRSIVSRALSRAKATASC